MALPRLMLAPNGARRTRADHPALPMTIPEIVATARAAADAGADGIHPHLRDGDGRHVLDAGMAAELNAELAGQVPGMLVQTTTEAAGRYDLAAQRAFVRALRPAALSAAVQELAADPADPQTRAFYHDAAGQAQVQHILYVPGDALTLGAMLRDGVVPAGRPQVLFVLGRKTDAAGSAPSDLDPFLAALAQAGIADADWAACAFGPAETACLVAAHRRGGKARIGFENNLAMADGSVALDNAARVRELVAALAEA